MHGEREELAKRVFPEIRRWCEARGLAFQEIDLRWGITDEAKADAQVLRTCLAEIDRCRPFFIGLLGDRYGWVPPESERAIFDSALEWIAGASECSVTELEMRHGALREPSGTKALFYFRNSAPGVPEETRSPTEKSLLPDRHGGLTPEQEPERVVHDARRLVALKDSISSAGFQPKSYGSLSHLGDLVHQNLMALLDQLYPADSAMTAFEAEVQEHLVFADRLVRFYIKRSELHAALDEYVVVGSPPLIVVGEAGCGKSTLLAAWSRAFAEKAHGALVVQHFVGATYASCFGRDLSCHVISQLQDRLGLPMLDPYSLQPPELKAEFRRALTEAGKAGNTVLLVLDGLDQLEEAGGSQDLPWLPWPLAPHVQLIASVRPGVMLERWRTLGADVLQVGPLDHEERAAFVTRFLKQYGKHVSLEQRAAVVRAKPTANARFLRLLLEELRLFGYHELLDEHLDRMLQCNSPEDLYDLVIERCERDYDRDRPGLVRTVLRFLTIARTGLSERELAEIAGPDMADFLNPTRESVDRFLSSIERFKEQGLRPLASAYLSPLLWQFDVALARRGELVRIIDDALVRSIERRYSIAGSMPRKHVHGLLATYFAAGNRGDRQVLEMPYQMEQAGHSQQFAKLLSEPLYLSAVRQVDIQGLSKFWAKQMATTANMPLDAYREVLAHPEQFEVTHVNHVAITLLSMGIQEAYGLWEHLVDRYHQAGEVRAMYGALVALANATSDLEGPRAALPVYRRALAVARDASDRQAEALCLRYVADLLHQLGEIDTAQRLCEESFTIFESLRDWVGQQACWGLRGRIFLNHGRLMEALDAFHHQQELCSLYNLEVQHARSLEDEAQVHNVLQNNSHALLLLQQAENVFGKHGALGDAVNSLTRQAWVLANEGQLSEALSCAEEAERIQVQRKYPRGVAEALGHQVFLRLFRAGVPQERALSLAHSLLRRLVQQDPTAWAGRAAELAAEAQRRSTRRYFRWRRR